MKHIYTSSESNQTMYWRIMLRINIVLILLLFVVAFGWINAAKNIRIDIPPDLSSATTINPEKRQPHVIYDFAFNIFQQLQRWKKDGKKDYKENIAQYSNYLTPSYVAFLNRDYTRRAGKGELNNRQRTVQPMSGIVYENDRVQQISKGTWVVFLDIDLEETYLGENIKKLSLRYPVVVKSYDVDRQENPWGLALDGYYSNPEKITEEVKNAK